MVGSRPSSETAAGRSSTGAPAVGAACRLDQPLHLANQSAVIEKLYCIQSVDFVTNGFASQLWKGHLFFSFFF